MKTVALVIGNNAYYKGCELKNAVNDATAIAQVFERLHIDVILKTDCNTSDLSDVLEKFEKKIEDNDASIFYFAGHGFEVSGENYLAGTECQIGTANKYECNRTCIRLSEVLGIYKKQKNKIHIAIIDACRKSFDRGSVVGFSSISAPRGTFIAFSTSPNEGASDEGFEDHSVFTGAMLKYIGRENMSVEDLFKKVRKTVYVLTEGRQTTWEHTSLLGDYYFNTDQMVYSPVIPYDEKVVKDSYYENDGSLFNQLIMDLKSHNWHKQNPAVDKLLGIPVINLDKNQLFILGRNLLQASGAAHNAANFMEKIDQNIDKYLVKGENHLLNGILFEIYFDSMGEFRKEKTKTHFFENIIKLRKDLRFKNSFDFINKLLKATDYLFIYIPESTDKIIDIDVVATTKKTKNVIGEEVTTQVISSITYNGINLTRYFMRYDIIGKNEAGLKQSIANFFTAPTNLVQINCGIELKQIEFEKAIIDNDVLNL